MRQFLHWLFLLATITQVLANDGSSLGAQLLHFFTVLGIPASREQTVRLIFNSTTKKLGPLDASTHCGANRIQYVSEGNTITAIPEPRALPSAAFPVLVCELVLPRMSEHGQLTLANSTTIHLPIINMDRQEKNMVIAFIADTGCQLKKKKAQQCNDPSQWPFQSIASKIAKDVKPVAVAHIGDYLYRESAPQCGVSSPCGDTWGAFEADFFDPGRALLQTSPWIFVRGNHEICTRGGLGYFLLLSPEPYPQANFATTDYCANYTQPYDVTFGNMTFIVMDSSDVFDEELEDVEKNADEISEAELQEQIGQYGTQFKSVRVLAETAAAQKRPSLWLSHRPLFGFKDVLLDYTLEQAMQASGGDMVVGLRIRIRIRI